MSDENATGQPNRTLAQLLALPKTPVDVVEPAMVSGDVKLSDGTVLRVRVIVTAAARIEGAKDAYGRPVYTVETSVVTSVKHAEKGA